MSGSRVLVVGDEYYATLAAVRGLRAAGYEPWLATTTDRTLAGRSRAVAGVRRVPHPEDGVEAFLSAMEAFVRDARADVVLPGTEPSLAVLAGREIGVRVAAPAPELVARATDKQALAAHARAAGLRSPPSARVTVPGEAPDVALPAIVKPVRTTVRADGRTVNLPRAERVESREQLAERLSRLPPGDYLVQPFLPGRLGALAGVAWNGETICVAQQRSVRIEPPEAGASAFAETVPLDPELAASARRLLGALGWSGVWELQFIDDGGSATLIDFNPRFYGSLALAIGAGLNLPAIWVDLITGREPRVGAYRPGVRFRAEGRDAKILLGALRRGDLRTAAAVVTPRRRTVHAISSLRDPGPLVAFLARR